MRSIGVELVGYNTAISDLENVENSLKFPKFSTIFLFFKKFSPENKFFFSKNRIIC